MACFIVPSFIFLCAGGSDEESIICNSSFNCTAVGTYFCPGGGYCMANDCDICQLIGYNFSFCNDGSDQSSEYCSYRPSNDTCNSRCDPRSGPCQPELLPSPGYTIVFPPPAPVATPPPSSPSPSAPAPASALPPAGGPVSAPSPSPDFGPAPSSAPSPMIGLSPQPASGPISALGPEGPSPATLAPRPAPSTVPSPESAPVPAMFPRAPPVAAPALPPAPAVAPAP